MTAALLLGTALLAAPADTPSQGTELAAYREAAAKVGRDPGEHVKLALWCEAHGLDAERLKHLALAVLIEPKDAAARGLMGVVSFRGRWLRPEAVDAKIAADAEL